MRLGDVQIPPELEDARREGRLVLFVGAGASMSPPTNLPSFKKLVEDLEKDAGRPYSRSDDEPPLGLDRRLGRLADARYAVHHRAAEIIARSRKPNEVHKTVRRLARSSPQQRIVTTNFDRHLEADTEHTLEQYIGPALPMGDDFQGLVYLHGRSDGAPGSLILTDADFGRAYLTDAWAARFVERMYREYSVLFIGYSLGDPVMQYAVRGMRSGGPHFALVADDEAEQWSPYGLTLLRYPLGEGPSRHDAVGETMARWADRVEGGWLDQRERIRQLVARPPTTLDPEETDFVQDILANDTLTAFFTDLAEDPAWLDYLAGEHELGGALTRSDATQRDTTLCQWVASRFLDDEIHAAKVWRIVANHGGVLNNPMAWCVARAVCRSEVRPTHHRRWLLLLAEQLPPTEAHWLETALDHTDLEAEWAEALHLLDVLTRPLPRPDHLLDRVDATTRGSQQALQTFRTRVIDVLDWEKCNDLVILAEQQMKTAGTLGASGSGGDPWSEERGSIADEPAGHRREVSDELVDLARDAAQCLLAHDSSEGDTLVARWVAASAPLLRRLATHLQAWRDDVSPPERLDWFLRVPDRYERVVHPETYAALRRLAEELEGDDFDALVADVASVDDGAASLLRLLWLAASGGASARLDDEIARLREDVGQLELGDHPDRTSWHEVGIYIPARPMDSDSFIELLQTSPDDAFSVVMGLSGVARRWNGEPDWQGALAMTREAAVQDPRAVVPLLELAAADPAADDVVRAVLTAFAEVTDPDFIAPLMAAVADLEDAFPDELTRMINGWLRKPDTRAAALRCRPLRDLATNLWAAIDLSPTHGDGNSPMERAVNDSAGHLAEFWIRVAIYENNPEAGPGQGLDREAREQLDRMLDDHRAVGHPAIPAIASQLHLLHYLDPDWARQRVLPLLSMDAAPKVVAAAWDGFLTQGRFDVALLLAGLRDAYLALAGRIEQILPMRLEQYANHIADSATLSPPSPEWLTRWTAHAPLDVRLHFLERVAWLIGRMEENRATQWDSWLGEYWQGRVVGRGAELGESEQLALIAIGSEITERSNLVVQLATQRPAPLDSGRALFFHMRRALGRSPEHVRALLLHVLRSSDSAPQWAEHDLAEMTGLIRERLGEEAATEAIEAALAAGFHNAGKW